MLGGEQTTAGGGGCGEEGVETRRAVHELLQSPAQIKVVAVEAVRCGQILDPF